jgi:RHS repeat-associated protein
MLPRESYSGTARPNDGGGAGVVRRKPRLVLASTFVAVFALTLTTIVFALATAHTTGLATRAAAPAQRALHIAPPTRRAEGHRITNPKVLKELAAIEARLRSEAKKPLHKVSSPTASSTLAGSTASKEPSATAAGPSTAGALKGTSTSAGEAPTTGAGGGNGLRPHGGPSSCTVETTYDGDITAASPVLDWPMNETSGTTATDTSGNSYDGTYSGGVTPLGSYDGPFYGSGGGQSFDGSTGVLTGPSTFSGSTFPSGAFTINAWIDPSSSGSTPEYQAILGNEDVDGSGNWYGIGLWGYNEGGTGQTYTDIMPVIGLSGGGLDYVPSSTEVPNDQWSHITLIWFYDTGAGQWDLTFWVNGTQQGDSETDGYGGDPASAFDSTPFTVGDEPTMDAAYGYTFPFEGAVSDVSVTDMAMSLEDYSAYSSSPSTLTVDSDTAGASTSGCDGPPAAPTCSAATGAGTSFYSGYESKLSSMGTPEIDWPIDEVATPYWADNTYFGTSVGDDPYPPVRYSSGATGTNFTGSYAPQPSHVFGVDDYPFTFDGETSPFGGCSTVLTAGTTYSTQPTISTTGGTGGVGDDGNFQPDTNSFTANIWVNPQGSLHAGSGWGIMGAGGTSGYANFSVGAAPATSGPGPYSTPAYLMATWQASGGSTWMPTSGAVGPGVAVAITSPGVVIPTNAWTLITLTYDASNGNLTLYLNGANATDYSTTDYENSTHDDVGTGPCENSGSVSCNESLGSTVNMNAPWCVTGSWANPCPDGPVKVADSNFSFLEGAASSSQVSQLATAGGLNPITAAELFGGGSASEQCQCPYLTGGGVPVVHYSKDPVDTATGDYSESATDLSIPGAGVPLTFSRTYDAQAAQAEVGAGASAGPLGFGWSDNLGMSVSYDSSTEVATVTEENGAQTTFTPYVSGYAPDWCSGSTNFCPTNPRVEATLNQNTGGSWTYVRTVSAPETFSFNSSGSLTEIADATGDNLTASSYSPTTGQTACPSGDACTAWSSSASGREMVLAVNSSGRLVEAFDANSSLAAIFAYSGTGCTSWGTGQTPDLCSATDPGSITATYTYDSGNSNANLVYDMLSATPVTSSGQPAAGQVTNTYDSSGRVTQQTDPDSNVTTYAYSGDNGGLSGGTTTVTSYPDGTGSGEPTDVTVDSYVYNALVQEQQDFVTGGTAQTATTTITRDPGTDQATATTGPNGATTTNTYDINGNLLTSTDALGNETEYAYTTSNQVWCEVKPAEVKNGVTCPSTQPTSPPAPGATDPDLGATITFYNSADQVSGVTDPLGNTSTYSYTNGVSGVPNHLLYCEVDPADYQASVTCPAYGATHVTGTTTETYDSAGDETSQTTATGATTSYSYSYASTHPGLVSSSTDADGTGTAYTYNGAGEPTQITSTFGTDTSTTLKAYDAEGRLYCEVDPIEAAASVTCPSSPPSSSSPPADVTSTFYDADGNVIQTTNALGGTTQTAYDGIGLVYCTVSPKNYASSVRCPSTEPTTQPTPTSDPYSGAVITGYNALGLPIQVTNAIGGIKTETYNAYGQLASTTTESNNVTADPDVTTAYSYDADNDIVSQTVGSGTSAQTTLSSYDPDGNVYCTVSAKAHAAGTSAYQCPPWQAGWVFNPPNPSGLYSTTPTSAQANDVTTSFYNDNGQLVQSTSPDVATTIDVLNADGKAYCTSDPTNVGAYLAAHSGATYPYNCPASAPTTQPTSGSNPGYATTIYDASGNVVSQSNANADITSHTYDAAGDVLSTTDPNGNVSDTCYYDEDATGQCANSAPSSGGLASDVYSTLTPATSADPSGELTTFTYGPDGQTATQTTPAGTDTFTYDAAGDQLTSTWSSVASGYAAPATVTDTYNSDGTLASETDATGTTTYAYDDNGDQTSQALVAGSGTGLSNATTSYAYFDTGVTSGITYPAYGSYSSPAVTYAYDATGNIVSSTDWLGNVVTYSHDADNDVTGQDNNVSSGAPNGTSNDSVAYSADGVALGSTATTCAGGTTGTVGVSTPDSVNADGQVTSASFSNTSCGATATTNSAAYTYTTAGQVASENINGIGASSFTYDTAGNLTQMTQPAGAAMDTFTQAVDGAGEVTSQIPVSGSGGSSTSFTYDTLGDQTAATGAISDTTSYNAAGQMASQSSSSATTTYLYAGDGLETGASTTTGSTTDTTQLTWDRSGDLAGLTNPEVISDGTDDYVFGPAGTPAEEIATASSTPTYLDYDSANDSWTATTQTGTLAGFWGYDAYGTLAFGMPVSGYGYAGQFTDAASGLSNDRARFYDALTGTFTTRDPAFAQTDSAYTYAGGDPVNGGDPTGLEAACQSSDGSVIFVGEPCPRNPRQTQEAEQQIQAYYAAPSSFSQLGHNLEAGFQNLVGARQTVCSTVGGDIADSAKGGLFALGLLTGVPESVGSIDVGELFGLSTESATAASRVEQLQGVLDPIAQNSRTSAVLNTREGIDVLASGGRDLSQAQQALANEEDLLARMPGAHAEVTALQAASKAGLTPSEMAVSRLICSECQAFIENTGGTITSGGTGATWP